MSTGSLSQLTGLVRSHQIMTSLIFFKPGSVLAPDQSGTGLTHRAGFKTMYHNLVVFIFIIYILNNF